MLRRLRRLARVYGAEPQFLLASATIANPGELAHSLLGVDVDGRRRRRRAARRADDRALEPAAARRGARPARERARRGVAAAWPASSSAACGRSASPRAAGRPSSSTASRPSGSTPRRAGRLAPYRAGYTPAQRREIERRLVEGELLGVTRDRRARARHRRRPARLRDLGRLPRHGRDAAAAVGPRRPTRARARRPRRERGRARPVLHARARRRCSDAPRRGGDPRPREPARPRRPRPRGRVRGAARRRRPRAPRRRGARARRRAARAAAARRAGFVWAGRDYPAARVPLRSTTPDSFTIVDADDRHAARAGRARARVHDRPRGRRSTCTSARPTRCSSSTSRRAPRSSQPFSGDWYTQAKKETNTADRRDAARRAAARARAVVRRVVRDGAGDRLPAPVDRAAASRSTSSPLDLPETTFETEAVWYLPTRSSSAGLEQMPRCSGTLHAAEHAMIAILPLWAMCDRWDIGGLSTNVHFQTGRADGVRLRRPRRRRRDRRARLRRVRGLGRRHREAARRLPVHERLPVVRAVAEVRQPERAPRQGGRARAPDNMLAVDSAAARSST